MIEFRKNEVAIVDKLQAVLSKSGRPCPVIRANQVSPVPDYPYCSYTVITPVASNNKGYCVATDGTVYKELKQIWSFTVQSDDSTESQMLSAKAYDWFSYSGDTYMSDNGIVAQSVGNIMNRDNLISINYEYRNGFDVTFVLIHKIDEKDLEYIGTINEAPLNEKEE